jgi:iron complex outermembrane receptor protein
MKQLSFIVSLMTSATATAGMPAIAQTSIDTGTTSGVENLDGQDETADTQDIVVTAQKRAQRLQDVPITISVIGAQEIEQARVDQLVDVANRTPGLNFDAFPSTQPRPAIRGIGSSDRGAAGDPSTAVYIDDVYYGRPAAVAFDAFDVARIEVLKGPQGTLWGKNVVGGLIHIVNARPQLGDADWSVQGTIGSYFRTDAAGFINLPTGDRSALRISASTRNRDGFAKNTFRSGRTDDEHTSSGRIQYLVEPTGRLSLLFGADYTRDRLAGGNRHTLGVDPSSPQRVVWQNAIDPDPETTRQDINGYQNRDSYGMRLGADWDVAPFTVTSISSYRRLRYHVLEDADGGNPTTNRINARGGQDENTEFWSQEVRLAAPDSSRIKWVLGGYYFHGDTERVDTLVVDLPPFPSNSFAALDQFDQRAVTDSYAAFGDVTIPLLDRLNVFGGIRYSRDDKTYDLSTANSQVLLRSASRYTIDAKDDWSRVTYRAGLDVRITPDVMLYGLTSTGFKSGGFQDTPSTAASARIPFNPESATNYEVGVKATLFDRKLVFNPAMFWIDYDDLQVRQTIGLDTFTSNAGSARIKGAELTMSAGPFGGFNLGATYAFTDARFRQLVDRGVDYAGNRLTRSPRNKVTVSPSYRFDLPSGMTVTAAADYQYESRIFDDFNNSPVTVRDPKNLFDARLILAGRGRKWDLSIWAKNLTNETYIVHQFLLLGGRFATYGPLRTVGATVTIRR